MSHNYYSEINLHYTWHTKESAPLLTPEVEEMVFAALREKATKLGGICIHELGAIPTHIHMALSMEPTWKPSELVGELKGYSSHEVNRRLGLGRKLLQWQSGYGVVSFGTKDLPWVCEYVRNQKEHHASGNVHERLETITHPEDEAGRNG
jgi:putative transposase